MYMHVSAESQKTARALLARPDLYEYYLSTIASRFVLAKSERGKKACFRLWKNDLEFEANMQLKGKQ